MKSRPAGWIVGGGEEPFGIGMNVGEDSGTSIRTSARRHADILRERRSSSYIAAPDNKTDCGDKSNGPSNTVEESSLRDFMRDIEVEHSILNSKLDGLAERLVQCLGHLDSMATLQRDYSVLASAIADMAERSKYLPDADAKEARGNGAGGSVDPQARRLRFAGASQLSRNESFSVPKPSDVEPAPEMMDSMDEYQPQYQSNNSWGRSPDGASSPPSKERSSPRPSKLSKKSHSHLGSALERSLWLERWNSSASLWQRPRRPSLNRSTSTLGTLGNFSDGVIQGMSEILSRVRDRTDLERNIWNFLEDPDFVAGGRLYMRMISTLIVASTALSVGQTMNPPPLDSMVAIVMNVVIDSLFAFEILARCMCCPNRLTFFLSSYNLLDIGAIGLFVVVHTLSSTLSSSVPTSSILLEENGDNNVLLIATLALPVVRLLRLFRRFESIHLLRKAFYLASEVLPVLLFILSILVLVFASILFFVEPRSNIDSLPEALWFTIVTMGTIGYGDITPDSPAGSVVTSVLIIVSALYMAIPLGIVGKAFSTMWDDRDRLLMMHRARMRFLSSGYLPRDVPAMFYKFDRDNNGVLSLDEFLTMMQEMQIEFTDERVIQLFSSFDSNGSGMIDDYEFVRTLFPEAFTAIYGRPDVQANAEKAEGD